MPLRRPLEDTERAGSRIVRTTGPTRCDPVTCIEPIDAAPAYEGEAWPMAKLVGSVPPGNFGENRFLSRARAYLDDRHIIYWNRQLFGREFDVCILMPGKGILVVELKGRGESTIPRVEPSDPILIRTPEGEVPSNPQKQARGYRFSLEGRSARRRGNSPWSFRWYASRRSPEPITKAEGWTWFWRSPLPF